MRRPWIGVDLDGTLAFYDRWRGPTHIGPPIPRMLDRIKCWIEGGELVKIFTARVAVEEPQRSIVIEVIQDYCEAHGLPRLEVTNVKDFDMVELYDDRAWRIVANTGDIWRGQSEAR